MTAGIRSGTNNDGYIQVNGSDIITALSSGNVGIGNTSPSTKLHVNGTVTATNFAGAVTGTSSGNPTLTNGANNRIVTATGANALTGETNLQWDGETLYINRSSNTVEGLSISNSNNSQGSAAAQLNLSGGDNSYANIRLECNGTLHHIRQDGSGNLKFYNNTTDRVHITSAGKLSVKSSAANAVYLSLIDNDSSNEIWRVGQASDGDGYVEVLEDGGTVGCKLDASGNSFTMGNFGVGVASPGHPLHVKNTAACIVQVEATNSNTSSIIQLLGKNSSGTVRTAKLAYDNADEVRLITPDAIPIVLMTQNAPRLTITSGGNVTVAANSDIRFTNGTWTGEVAGKIQHNSNNLYIQGGTGGIRFRHASSGANHFSMTNGGNLEASTGDIVFGTTNKGILFPNSVSVKQNNSNLYLNVASGNNNIEFASNGTSFVKLRGTNGDVEIVDGDLVMSTAGHGISFAVTGHAAGMENELLDDYEEGTWTPTIFGGTTAGSYSYESVRTGGRYTKIGNLVYIEGVLRISAINSAGAGPLNFGGLPYSFGAKPASSWNLGTGIQVTHYGYGTSSTSSSTMPPPFTCVGSTGASTFVVYSFGKNYQVTTDIATLSSQYWIYQIAGCYQI